METATSPFRIQVKYAKRGERLATSWNVPAGWPEDTDTRTGDPPMRRIVLGIEKRTRAGSTGRIRWDLYETLGPDEFADIDRGLGTFADLEVALGRLRLAV